MGFNFFGPRTLLEKILNPAGAIHGAQNEDQRKAAKEATDAARAQAAAAEANVKLQQEALTLQAEQAALAAQKGQDARTTTTATGIDTASPLKRQRKRGADVTVGL